ncbi:uncharacterized protein CIMG_13616 [Coccidioides immitis RS]|uniref:Uncharacterized protein n=1 Tax=Coccidioides immitis (strain RS) TaxID=246410 RepID=A0A0D8JVQ0_COCIM|nr:uncharacterized protein CIMG_13616 [Coccidioides immitis RS]KJF61387.1 hypothetical protein CIMG_13616 [Coccidioides immitis RS]
MPSVSLPRCKGRNEWLATVFLTPPFLAGRKTRSGISRRLPNQHPQHLVRDGNPSIMPGSLGRPIRNSQHTPTRPEMK